MKANEVLRDVTCSTSNEPGSRLGQNHFKDELYRRHADMLAITGIAAADVYGKRQWAIGHRLNHLNPTALRIESLELDELRY